MTKWIFSCIIISPKLVLRILIYYYKQNMKTNALHRSLPALCVLVWSILVFGFVKVTAQEVTEVQISITSGNINIFSTGTFNFGQYTVSSSNQTVTGAFTDYFSVEDLKGAFSGYYTSVQMDGNLTTVGGASIASTGIAMSVTTTGVTLIAGTVNPRVVVANSMISWQSLDTPRTLILRDPAANFWVVGHYGTLPQMQVLIPAFQSVGVYTGTLTYTLYEN